MSRLLVMIGVSVALLGVTGCQGIGKGKGKGPAPVVYEEPAVTK